MLRVAMKPLVSLLPPSLPPRGLSRVQAAEYIGVGATKFDEMVQDGRMPPAKRIDSRTVWDRVMLDEAFAALPVEGELPPVEGQPVAAANEWDNL